MDIALQFAHKGTDTGNWSAGSGKNWYAKGYQGGKGGKDANLGGKNSRQKDNGKEESKGQEKGGVLDLWKTRYIAAWCEQPETVVSESEQIETQRRTSCFEGVAAERNTMHSD